MIFSQKYIKANDEVCYFDHHVPSPYFRKSFTLEKVPESAEITISGLGFYRLWINGKDITKGPLSPYISNVDDIRYYDNYDISELLLKGENIIGVQLGNGFRNPFGGFVWDFDKAPSRGPVCLALCVEADGKVLFEADESFKTHPSPVTFDDIRMGCRYDARLEIPDWNKPGFNDSDWANAMVSETPKGYAKLCEADPIETLREIRPKSVTHYDRLPFGYQNKAQDAAPIECTYRDNVYVFDFGVNTAGVTKLHINGRPGQVITIRHAEHTVRGNFAVGTTMFFDTKTMPRTLTYLQYGQVDVYTCRGGDEVFVPDFKYDGFRYAYVEGLEPDQITDDVLTLVEQSSYMESRAVFNSSNEILNKLQDCTLRSDRANFFWFPTDCPHREKNGWTGDASVSAEQFLLNFRMSGLLKEWLCNIRAAQREDGNLPGIIPTGGWGFQWGNGPAWDAVIVNLPYYIYKFDGDREVVLDNKDMILRYFRFGLSKLDERGLADFGLGDWLYPYRIERGGIPSPVYFTSTAQYFDIGRKAAQMFREVGETEAAKEAEEFSTRAKAAIRQHLIDFETMTVEGNCQTSQAVAIEMGIFEENELPAAREKLVQLVHEDGDIMACGLIGVRYILHALINAGETDLAFKIVTRTDVRSCYGYLIANGATSLWESFIDVERNVDSRNHHFLGNISNFMIQDIAGLRPNPRYEGLDTFEIVPHFPKELDSAEAEYESYIGKVSVKWEKDRDAVKITVNNPENAKTRLILQEGWRLSDSSCEKTVPCGETVFTVRK